MKFGRETKSGASRRHLKMVSAAVGFCLLLSVGGVLATRFVRSPAQVAADTKQPPATPITALVESRQLVATQILRGKVYPGVQYEITPSAPSGDIKALYVSASGVKPGERVAEGSFLAAVSGRPIFVLHGAVPAYRDLTNGASGPDVRQLQEALAELGYRRGGDRKGYFGSGTAGAVRRFYADRDYPAVQVPASTPSPTPTSTNSPKGSPSPSSPAVNNSAGTTPAPAVIVPTGELIFLPSLPATVTSVAEAVGHPVDGALLTLTTGSLVATGRLSADLRDQLRAGMPASIADTDSGTSVKGRVTSIGRATTKTLGGVTVAIGGADTPTSNADASSGAEPYIPVTLAGISPIPRAFSGKDVVITVDTQSSQGKVLVVPVSSVTTSADGVAQVSKIGADGTTTNVPVKSGISADGFVKVEPIKPATLSVGDSVLIGAP